MDGRAAALAVGAGDGYWPRTGKRSPQARGPGARSGQSLKGRPRRGKPPDGGLLTEADPSVAKMRQVSGSAVTEQDNSRFGTSAPTEAA